MKIKEFILCSNLPKKGILSIEFCASITKKSRKNQVFLFLKFKKTYLFFAKIKKALDFLKQRMYAITMQTERYIRLCIENNIMWII